MEEKVPKDLMYQIIIYSRDLRVKADDFPDGKVTFNSLGQITMYDRCMIKEYIGSDFE